MLGGAVWFAMRRGSPPIDPTFGGKKLSVLLDDRQFVDGDMELTADSAHAVRALGTDAIPYLFAMLESSGTNSDSSMKRDLAQMGFQTLGEEARPAYPKLVSLALTSPDYWIKYAAINALMKADQNAIKPLALALESPDSEVRARAALALRWDRNAPDIAVPALTGALTDPDAEVRANAVEALGAYLFRGSHPDIARKLVPQITALLNDQSSAVSNGAAEALRDINLKPALP